MHKASYSIIQYCLKHNVDTIVIGKNKGWKQVSMRKDDKQNFVGIPFNLFISILTYKANAQGIYVIETEESYTSQASFFDNDPIPVYKEGVENNIKFSGKRIKRGLYRTADGFMFNADINGALNIIRKAVPGANWTRDRGVVSTTFMLSIA